MRESHWLISAILVKFNHLRGSKALAANPASARQPAHSPPDFPSTFSPLVSRVARERPRRAGMLEIEVDLPVGDRIARKNLFRHGLGNDTYSLTLKR